MTFQLDTTGTVRFRGFERAPGFDDRDHIWWSDLDPFTQGYIEALFASVGGFEAIRADDLAWPGKTSFLGFSDLAPETLARIIEDCASFQNVANGLGNKTHTAEGRRFWNGRQGGLSGAFGAAYPPLTVQLSNDGKVSFA